MAYNMSFIDTSNTIYDVAVATNSLSNGAIGFLILFFVFMFMYIITGREDKTTGIIVGGAASSVIGGLLWFINLFPYEFISIPLIVLVIGLSIKFFGD